MSKKNFRGRKFNRDLRSAMAEKETNEKESGYKQVLFEAGNNHFDYRQHQMTTIAIFSFIRKLI